MSVNRPVPWMVWEIPNVILKVNRTYPLLTFVSSRFSGSRLEKFGRAVTNKVSLLDIKNAGNNICPTESSKNPPIIPFEEAFFSPLKAKPHKVCNGGPPPHRIFGRLGRI